MPSRRRTPSSIALFTATLLAVSLTPGYLTGCGTAPVIPVKAQSGQGADFTTGYPVEPGHARQLGYDVRWVHDLPLGPGQSVSRVLEDAGTLLTVETPENIVTAISPETGNTLWKTVVGTRLETVVGMTSDDRWVYVNTATRLFKLARRGGVIKSVGDLQYPVNSSPLKIGRLAVFGSDVGNVFAHHLDDGYTKWAYGLGAPIQAALVQAERDLFAVDTAGRYAMLDTTSGKLLWRGQFYAGVSSNPTIHNGFVLAASEDQSLYSLGQTNGKDRWPAYRSEARLTTTPVVHGGGIFLNEPGVGLSGIAADTGERHWQFEGDARPFAVNGKTLVAHGDGFLVTLNMFNGDVRNTVPTRPLLSAQSDDRGRLLLCSTRGSLTRLAPTTATAAAPALPAH